MNDRTFNSCVSLCRSTNKVLPSRFRSLIQRLLKSDPLKYSEEIPPITVVIPCKIGDVWKLELAILALQLFSRNPIRKVIVISPHATIRMMNSIKSFVELVVVCEEDLVGVRLMEFMRLNLPVEKMGWTVQQVATWAWILKSEEEFFLRLDADTLLLQERTFFGDGLQILFPVVEYERLYDISLNAISRKPNFTGFSYVSHHQAIQKSILTELIGEQQPYDFFTKWICAQRNYYVPISEYHTYGNFLICNFKEKVRVARWGNARVSESDLLKMFTRMTPIQIINYISGMNKGLFSVSVHHYQQSSEIAL